MTPLHLCLAVTSHNSNGQTVLWQLCRGSCPKISAVAALALSLFREHRCGGRAVTVICGGARAVELDKRALGLRQECWMCRMGELTKRQNLAAICAASVFFPVQNDKLWEQFVPRSRSQLTMTEAV